MVKVFFLGKALPKLVFVVISCLPIRPSFLKWPTRHSSTLLVRMHSKHL